MFGTTDKDGDKGIGGGLMKHQSSNQTVTNYVTVPSIYEYLSRIEKSGKQ